MKHIYLAIIAIFLSAVTTAQVATFDDLSLDAEEYWNGDDLSGSFTSGGFVFMNSYNSDWFSWSGFAYSNTTDATTASYENQYSAIAGSGNKHSANYAVCYASPLAEVVLPKKSKISGFYITNSTYAYLSMKNGDAFSKKFGGETGNDPDFFKLTIKAYDESQVAVDSIEFYLADFRFDDNSKDYIINKWIWFDLSAMKDAQKLVFSLSSSDNSFGYMNTPAYFCMDDFNGEKPYEYQSVTYASFDDLNLGSESFYNGRDLKGGFESGNFRFLNDYSADWGSWSGFAASTTTDVETASYSNQYSAITGGGVVGTPGYAVVYPVPVATVMLKDTLISGLYVTNSTYAYLSMKNGDAFSKKFGGETGDDKDWFILTIEGFDSEDKSTGKVEVYLADFSYSNNAYDYILDYWKWVNLEKLGFVSKLQFSLRSSDNGVWGMNTPAYFCIDNLNHQSTTSAPVIAKQRVNVYPNPFAEFVVLSGIQDKATVTLTDVSGKMVARYTNVSNNQAITNLENLKSGIYFLNILEGKQSTTTKLIKK